jgi:hypothetical protein
LNLLKFDENRDWIWCYDYGCLGSRDPRFVTPQIKYMLRKKNRLMSLGRTDEVNAIHTKISTDIIAYNSVHFKNLSARTASRELWENIRDVTGKNKNHSFFANSRLNFSADDFNNYYSHQSTDCNYIDTPVKISVSDSNSFNIISEYTVFKLLDNIKTTATGADGLPHWFLKIAACSLADLLAYLYNLSPAIGKISDQ